VIVIFQYWVASPIIRRNNVNLCNISRYEITVEVVFHLVVSKVLCASVSVMTYFHLHRLSTADGRMDKEEMFTVRMEMGAIMMTMMMGETK
jgi:hypothetical protein